MPRKPRTTNKKRMYKKKRMNRKKPTKNFVKAVNSVIHKDVETKKQVYISSTTAFNQQISSSGDALRLMPSIPQGAANANRVGNEIRLQEVRVRGVITVGLDLTDVALTRLGVRLMVLKAKRFMDWIAAQTDFGTSYTRLLETQGTFDGSVQCINCPVNEDYYSCIYDKVFYFSSSHVATGGVSTEVWNSTKLFDFKLPYIRNRKLIYDDNYLSGDSTNFPYFMCFGAVKLDGTAASLPTATPFTVQYCSTVKYEDA